MFYGEHIPGMCVFLIFTRIQNLCSPPFLMNSGFKSALRFALHFFVPLKYNLFKKILLYHAINLTLKLTHAFMLL